MWSHQQEPAAGQQLLMQKQQQMQPAGLHLFPVQVGPPTAYALHQKQVLIGIVIFQALMTIVRLLEDKYRSIPIAIIMGLGVAVGWYAWKEDMNITYICWWTIFSLAGLIGGIVLAIFSFAIQVSTMVVLCIIPISCFCGVVLGWWLYVDYEEEYQTTDLVSSWLRYFGILPDHTSMLPAPGAAFAVAGSFPGLLNKVGGGPPPAYGSADLAGAKGTANQYWAGAQNQAHGWWNQGSAQAAGMQAQAAEQGRGWWNRGSAQAAGMQAQAAEQGRGFWNRGSAQAAGMQQQAQGQFANAQGQAAERFGLFKGQAGQQYNSMMDHAARKHGAAYITRGH